jgi:hypothetical protein
MNQDNYVSREVAQKLVDAGIVLETDCIWLLIKSPDAYRLRVKEGLTLGNGCNGYPAPCFAELWRELPSRFNGMGLLTTTKHYTKDVSICGYDSYENEDWISESFTNQNPADALAELLIWARGQKIVDRSHEECEDCIKMKLEPPICKGHAAGPSSCKQFKGQKEGK